MSLQVIRFNEGATFQLADWVETGMSRTSRTRGDLSQVGESVKSDTHVMGHPSNGPRVDIATPTAIS